VVTRYADVARLLRDPRLRNHFPSEYHRMSAGAGAAHELMQRIMLHHDDGQHTRLREVFAHSFRPEALARLRPRIRQVADDLLGAALAAGEVDAVRDLAAPLPVIVILDIVGMDHGDRDEIRRRVVDLGKAFASRVAAADRLAADAAAVWLRGYVSEALERRRRNPLDDLLSAIARTDARAFHEHELVDNVVFLLFASFETTTSVIATGWAALLERPDQLAVLQREPALIPRAVEEFIRYDSPIQSRLRFVHDPIEIGDRTIRAGRLLLLLLGSANRDPRQFPRPDDLDVARTPNLHVGFGVGDHYCLGAGLARMETAILLQSLLEKIAGMEPAGDAVRALEGPFRGYERVPMRLYPRAVSEPS
jgi:cytochrome P450